MSYTSVPNSSGESISQPSGSSLTSLENIRYELREQIAYVTIDRPKVLNALNAATINELEQIFLSIRDDSHVRVVLLTGGGDRAFVAGADINELAKASGDSGKALAERGQSVFSLIENCGKPVIACINGFALGGGCELALACTMRLASETAQIGQPEVRLGIVAGYGGTQRLPRLVGKGAALYLLLTGERINAQQALRIGLVNEVLPASGLIPRAEEIAKAIIASAPIAVELTLRAVNAGYDLPLQEGLAIEAGLIGESCESEDKNEGTRAFLEKRTPNWTAR